MDLKKNTCPIQANPVPPPQTVTQTHLLVWQSSSVCVCVCVCVCVSRILLPSHTSTASQPVRSGLLLPCSDDETQAQGDGIASFPESGRLETEYRSDRKPRALLAKHSLPWCGSGVQKQLPVSMLCVNGGMSAPGCTLLCFVWVHEWLRQFDIHWQDKKRRETSHTPYHIQS